ncbi:hypothetical protein [Runella sp.]|uniref:hypothetical protein n=1 Tax=Runella sp. TaxID=1960881 RepID=UPI003D13EC7E
MKTFAFLIAFCLVSALISYPFLKQELNGDNLSISVSESDDMYKISADYPEEKTRKMQRFLDDHLEPSGMSFVNAQLDGDIAPDNGMHFYIKASPGTLRIKFDKRKNSAASYRRMKKMGEELKGLLTEK